MIDNQHVRILAGIWGMKNLLRGNTSRAARWFAVADRHQDVTIAFRR
jgi:hypothetical protein